MSAIAGVGASSTLLYVPVQASALDSSGDAPDASTGAAAAIAGQDSRLLTDNPSASPLADLRSQIETAVTSAVSQLPDGSSPQNLFKAIRSAVEDALKANGLSPQRLGGHHGGHHHHAQEVSADASGAAGSDADGSSNQNALQGSAAGSTDLTGVFQALFQGFPSGTGLDVRV